MEYYAREGLDNEIIKVGKDYLKTSLLTCKVFENSVEDFRQFTNNAIGNRRLVEREARKVIRVIIAAADSWRKQSFDTATQHCLGSYLYPDSVSDGAPAVELYLASSLPPLTKLSRGSLKPK